jgi:hypothetical protein
MDAIVSRREMRCSTSSILRQIAAYADDILVMAGTEQTLIGTVVKRQIMCAGCE